ncbi:uncharacterized mitochondrial protein AtMg00860-like [Glycine max]|uniref:uncharacterized mitochondrial protein AtMg00860-like n=1 Tax=Glycine max TaxID=3847 RepID=UPI0003DED108|nr:uncharacterized mitochondrial protein AtMg00860-like [Glycine max]|eukprot:XP_006590145.1 uncharacterized protein LOC102669306 [Glycine max]
MVFQARLATGLSSQVEYLGHTVSEHGVEPIPTKVEVVHQWPTPKSARALRGFLGLSGFYRRFIKGYATMVAPLTTLFTKDPFIWTPTADKAFTDLKKALCKAPDLKVELMTNLEFLRFRQKIIEEP